MEEGLTVRDVWERLITYLAELGPVRESALGLEITVGAKGEHSPSTVEVVVTPQDWDTYVSTIFGTADPSITPIRGQVLTAAGNFRYVVYDGSYDWAIQDVPELADDVPPAVQGGRWFVVDKDGREVYFPDEPTGP